MSTLTRVTPTSPRSCTCGLTPTDNGGPQNLPDTELKQSHIHNTTVTPPLLDPTPGVIHYYRHRRTSNDPRAWAAVVTHPHSPGWPHLFHSLHLGSLSHTDTEGSPNLCAGKTLHLGSLINIDIGRPSISQTLSWGGHMSTLTRVTPPFWDPPTKVTYRYW